MTTFENGNDKTGTIPTVLIGGLTDNDQVRAIAIENNGTLKGGRGESGGGDASAANQQTQIALTSLLDKYALSDLEDGDTSYCGYVDKDGNWYIQKLTATTSRYFAGSSGYTTAWAGRAALSYDYFYTIF